MSKRTTDERENTYELTYHGCVEVDADEHIDDVRVRNYLACYENPVAGPQVMDTAQMSVRKDGLYLDKSLWWPGYDDKRLAYCELIEVYKFKLDSRKFSLDICSEASGERKLIVFRTESSIKRVTLINVLNKFKMHKEMYDKSNLFPVKLIDPTCAEVQADDELYLQTTGAPIYTEDEQNSPEFNGGGGRQHGTDYDTTRSVKYKPLRFDRSLIEKGNTPSDDDGRVRKLKKKEKKHKPNLNGTDKLDDEKPKLECPERDVVVVVNSHQQANGHLPINGIGKLNSHEISIGNPHNGNESPVSDKPVSKSPVSDGPIQNGHNKPPLPDLHRYGGKNIRWSNLDRSNYDIPARSYSTLSNRGTNLRDAWTQSQEALSPRKNAAPHQLMNIHEPNQSNGTNAHLACPCDATCGCICIDQHQHRHHPRHSPGLTENDRPSEPVRHCCLCRWHHVKPSNNVRSNNRGFASIDRLYRIEHRHTTHPKSSVCPLCRRMMQDEFAEAEWSGQTAELMRRKYAESRQVDTDSSSRSSRSVSQASGRSLTARDSRAGQHGPIVITYYDKDDLSEFGSYGADVVSCPETKKIQVGDENLNTGETRRRSRFINWHRQYPEKECEPRYVSKLVTRKTSEASSKPCLPPVSPNTITLNTRRFNTKEDNWENDTRKNYAPDNVLYYDNAMEKESFWTHKYRNAEYDRPASRNTTNARDLVDRPVNITPPLVAPNKIHGVLRRPQRFGHPIHQSSMYHNTTRDALYRSGASTNINNRDTSHAVSNARQRVEVDRETLELIDEVIDSASRSIEETQRLIDQSRTDIHVEHEYATQARSTGLHYDGPDSATEQRSSSWNHRQFKRYRLAKMQVGRSDPTGSRYAGVHVQSSQSIQ